jgi:hypothetical protein
MHDANEPNYVKGETLAVICPHQMALAHTRIMLSIILGPISDRIRIERTFCGCHKGRLVLWQLTGCNLVMNGLLQTC